MNFHSFRIYLKILLKTSNLTVKNTNKNKNPQKKTGNENVNIFPIYILDEN